MTRRRDARVEVLPWDSAFWGVRAARVYATSTDDLDDADPEIRNESIQWASLLVPIANTTLVNGAVRRGYEVVDVRTTLKTPVMPTGVATTPQLGGHDDEDQMAEIAATAFPASRFAVDPHLDGARCARFYETWVRNSLNGQMADAVVVARSSGQVDGFMTMRCDPDGAASLPLVAIRSDRRGVGLGARLLRDAIDWMASQGSVTVDVVTQLANTSAIRLYESAGFRMTGAEVWLHRWY